MSIVATLTPHKGHVCFLRMAGLILRRFPNTTFHIVGGAQAKHASYIESIYTLIAELGIKERVRCWALSRSNWLAICCV